MRSAFLHRPSPALRLAAWLLGTALVLSGCLPSSCRRDESRAIAPADSLSRQLAAGFTPDTLRLAWQHNGPADAPMAYPRTLRFGPEGRLYVSDAERNSLFVFSADGTPLREITWPEADVPYLAGWRADTLVVFNPEARRIDFLVEGAVVRSAPAAVTLPRGPLQYLAVTDSAIFLKAVGDEFDGYLARLNDVGRPLSQISLPGPAWRHAGLLRPWGDSLLSLTGFRPLVDVLAPGADALDSLALVGFDSPMLRRSYAFLQGEAHEAPLLTPAAAALGKWLFVLNLRPGWLRVDVFDRTGHLQHQLIEENPGPDRRFYPLDLAVRETAPGRYEIAVATISPRKEVRLYRWQAP